MITQSSSQCPLQKSLIFLSIAIKDAAKEAIKFNRCHLLSATLCWTGSFLSWSMSLCSQQIFSGTDFFLLFFLCPFHPANSTRHASQCLKLCHKSSRSRLLQVFLVHSGSGKLPYGAVRFAPNGNNVISYLTGLETE